MLNKKIQIVLRTKGWILEAISYQWHNHFLNYVKSELVIGDPIAGADIYLHFFYGDCKIVKNAVNIVYVTHISSFINALVILKQYKEGCYFLTMSIETKNIVAKICNDQSCVISHLPASLHFEKKPRDKNIIFGYFNKRHDDGRKNEKLLKSIGEMIDSSINSKLLIYGSGWNDFFKETNNNIEIDSSKFDKNVYFNYLKKCDYVIYLSKDEGAISILDASALAIPVIATNIGFHKELNYAKGSILINDSKRMLSIIKSIVLTNEIYEDINLSISNTILKICKINIYSKRNTGLNNYFTIFKINYVYPFHINIIVTIKYIGQYLFNKFNILSYLH
jgi:hypothetical protein